MRKSTTSYLFPDTNVWVALTYQRHVHHAPASAWFERTGDAARIVFCRFTQLGFLRLISSEAVMGSDGVLSQGQSWATYDEWLRDDRVAFAEEPAALEARFRELAQLKRPAPKDWADSYLASFAAAAEFTLVTFDSALHRKSSGAVLLKSA